MRWALTVRSRLETLVRRRQASDERLAEAVVRVDYHLIVTPGDRIRRKRDRRDVRVDELLDENRDLRVRRETAGASVLECAIRPCTLATTASAQVMFRNVSFIPANESSRPSSSTAEERTATLGTPRRL